MYFWKIFRNFSLLSLSKKEKKKKKLIVVKTFVYRSSWLETNTESTMSRKEVQCSGEVNYP